MTTGPTPATLKRINMRRFLEELRVRGPSTRAELTRATGVAPPTSSSIIADLVETGWLETGDARQSAKGRPGQIYRLASSSALVIGVLIGIDGITIAPAGLDGMPKADSERRIPRGVSYDDLLQKLASHCSELIGDSRCYGVGIGVPGLVNERSGRVALSPNIHFLDDHDLATDLAGSIGVDVVCTQEEHALCLAEQHLGGARELTDFAVLDVSAGMGMGVVSGGRYLAGKHGFAGEIGHVTVEPDGRLCGCGNRGCLETVATDTAFLEAVREARGAHIEWSTLQSVGFEAELERTLDRLSIGLAAISNVFDPEAIFIHGRILSLRKDVLPRLVEKTKARALRPSFDAVRLRHANGNKLYGALAGLLDRVFASVGPRLD